MLARDYSGLRSSPLTVGEGDLVQTLTFSFPVAKFIDYCIP